MKWRRLRLVVASPLHVGAKQPLTELDYAVSGNIAHILSPNAWIEWLSEQHVLEAFAAAQLQGQSPQQFLAQALAGARPPWKNLSHYSLTIMHGSPRGPVRPFVRDPWHRPYLPGSTLKGALRTALLAYWTLANPQAVETTIRELLPAAKHPAQVVAPLEERIYRDHTPAPLPGAMPKPLQELKVRDSEPLPMEAVALYPVEVWLLRPDGSRYQRAQIWAECLVPGTVISTAVALDGPGLDETVLYEAITRWGHHHWSQEAAWTRRLPRQDEAADTLRAFYEASPPAQPLRLGWGSGWAALGLGSLLSPETRQPFRSSRLSGIGSPQFPRSRRVAIGEGGSGWPLGWLQLELPS
ncbi:MAG: type III-A CRISPR-associated RAMP protein Csm5 [Firmicutes bacterium]|nr:type III-A CRISPR-associated RAMP protein Csm5 [Bacillota bacterium]